MDLCTFCAVKLSSNTLPKYTSMQMLSLTPFHCRTFVPTVCWGIKCKSLNASAFPFHTSMFVEGSASKCTSLKLDQILAQKMFSFSAQQHFSTQKISGQASTVIIAVIYIYTDRSDVLSSVWNENFSLSCCFSLFYVCAIVIWIPWPMPLRYFSVTLQPCHWGIFHDPCHWGIAWNSLFTTTKKCSIMVIMFTPQIQSQWAAHFSKNMMGIELI